MAKKLEDIGVVIDGTLFANYNGSASGFKRFAQSNGYNVSAFDEAFRQFNGQKFPDDLKFVYKKGTTGCVVEGHKIYFDPWNSNNPPNMQEAVFGALHETVIQVTEKKVARPKLQKKAAPAQNSPQTSETTPPQPVAEAPETTEAAPTSESPAEAETPAKSEPQEQDEQCTLKTYEENGKTVEEYYTQDDPPKLFLSQVKDGDKLERQTEYLDDGSEKTTAYDDKGAHTVVVKNGEIIDAYDLDPQDKPQQKLADCEKTVGKNFYDEQRTKSETTENADLKQAAWDEVYFTLHPDRTDEEKLEKIEDCKKSQPELYKAERQKAAMQMRDHLLERQKDTPFISEKTAISKKLDALYQQFPGLAPAQTSDQLTQADQEFFNSPGGQLFMMVATFLNALQNKGTDLITTILGGSTVAEVEAEKAKVSAAPKHPISMPSSVSR